MENHFGALVAELDRYRAEHEMAKAVPVPTEAEMLSAQIAELRRNCLPSLKPVISDIDAMLKAMPPPEPTPHEHLAKAQNLLKSLCAAGRLTGIQAAGYEARIHALALRAGPAVALRGRS